jgi:biotin carboxyl carrier protein
VNSTLLVQATGLEGQAGAAAESVELHGLEEIMLRAVLRNRTKHEAVSALAQALAAFTEPLLVVHFERDDSNALARAYPALARPNSSAIVSQERLRQYCDTACAHGHLEIKRLGGRDDLIVVAAPVHLRQRPPEAFAVVLAERYGSIDRDLLLVQLLAVHTTLWHLVHQSREAETESQTNAALLELLAKLGTAAGLHAACTTLVNELQNDLGFQRVAVGLCRTGRRSCRLEALSGTSRFDRHSEFTRAVEAALDEVVLRDALVIWPPESDADRHAALAHQKLCSLAEVECVVSSPLRDDAGQLVGAWLFLGARQFLERPATLRFIRAAERRMAGCLRLLERAERGAATRLLEKLTAALRSRTALWVAGAAVTLAAILAIPMPYRIACNCRIEPVARRFVVAPFDGMLEHAPVAPGDLVAQGDVLARMDGREIRWELAGLTAELDAAAKKRDSALASQNAGAAQLAKLDMERLELKIRLLEHRAEHLEIKSPIAGIVTTGDLEKAEGAPLEAGAMLFEVAPLDQMIVEIAVPEDEIAHVAVGQSVAVRLDAYPGRTWSGVISRVHPRSELRDHENIFVAEVTLENSDDLLRPGMNGQVKIAGPRHALGWNLFHKSWEALTRSLGW